MLKKTAVVIYLLVVICHKFASSYYHVEDYGYPLLFDTVETCLEGVNGPVVVAIGGGSGSGKTTLARALIEVLGENNVTYIPHDNYYKDISYLTPEERAARNFDHPDALDTHLLVDHLKQLKRNQIVRIPTYDFTTHSRLPGTEDIYPTRVVIVEGVLIFADDEVVNNVDIKIYVDTDADIRFIRRMQRDVQERQRSLDSVIEQYITTVRPMHALYVEPSKKHADIIIPSGYNAVALELVAHRLQAAVAHGV